MKTIPIYSKLLIDKVKNHLEIKDDLLALIEQAEGKNIIFDSDHIKTNITKCDFENNNDFKRPWVNNKMIESLMTTSMHPMIHELGFEGFHLHTIWFQQYDKGSLHGWHSHNQNYVGVYYLDMPENSPMTELFDGEKIISLDVKEGDITIFPAYILHRAPESMIDKKKTIISFNFYFGEVWKGPKFLERIGKNENK